MDALSETLSVVQLVRAVFIDAQFTAPWYYQSSPDQSRTPMVELGTERVIHFHVVTEGECMVEMEGHAPIALALGDAIIFPQGHAHRLTSKQGLLPDEPTRLDMMLTRRPRQMVYGGGGAATRLVCGYLACDARMAKMMLAGLPALVKVNLCGSRAGEWLQASLRYALSETRVPRSGGAGVLVKLAEVLFSEVLRAYMEEAGNGHPGWLAGVSDRIVGNALTALHKEPAHAWTLEELARKAGTSRSVLAKRFQKFVGTSPMQHLTRWRMLLAANMLRRTSASLICIAEAVGYHSDTSFIRAFQREFGEPPATWRRKVPCA